MADEKVKVVRQPSPAIPHVILDGPWGVSNAPQGQVVQNDMGGGSFSAPLDSDEASEAARFRQYANLQLRSEQAAAVKGYFTACRREHIESDIAHAVWMGAVNGFAVARGLDLSKLPVYASEAHGCEYLAKAYVSGYGASNVSGLAQPMSDQSKVVWRAAASAAKLAHRTGFAVTAAPGSLVAAKLVEAAAQLQAAFGRHRLVESMREMPREGAASDLKGEQRDKLNDEIAGGLSKWQMGAQARAEFVRALYGGMYESEPLTKQIEELKARAENQGGRWGMMAKRTLTMTRRAIRHSFRHRPCFVGAFRYPHRALIPAMDGRAWHAKLVGLGGTILLDHSGSMGINEAQLQELLHRSPLATIAAYSGGDYIASDGWSGGHLTILAKEGRYAAQGVWPRFPSANIVDGPALRWLAKQARPRVWISDGGVTSAVRGSTNESSNGAESLKLECALVCRMAGIAQYRSIVKYLESHHYLAQFR